MPDRPNSGKRRAAPAYRLSGDVTTQSLESLAIAAGRGRARVHVDTTNLGERIVGLGLGLGELSHRVRELASLLPGRIVDRAQPNLRLCPQSKRAAQRVAKPDARDPKLWIRKASAEA